MLLKRRMSGRGSRTATDGHEQGKCTNPLGVFSVSVADLACSFKAGESFVVVPNRAESFEIRALAVELGSREDAVLAFARESGRSPWFA